MNLKQISIAIYATWLTNKYGFRLKKVDNDKDRRRLRCEYAEVLMNKLNISVNVLNPEKLPKQGSYLLIVNHRSIIDPVITELCLRGTEIDGLWVSKKELYNSFFFGVFVRNAGTLLLDRQAKQMNAFFKQTKEAVSQGYSIFVFPEGTRNKTDRPLTEFKEGSQLIALKNRLDILPFHIKGNANSVLMDAIVNRPLSLTIDVEIGEIISYKDKAKVRALEQSYRDQFNLSD